MAACKKYKIFCDHNGLFEQFLGFHCNMRRQTVHLCIVLPSLGSTDGRRRSHSPSPLSHTYLLMYILRYHSRFFVQDEHETTYASK